MWAKLKILMLTRKSKKYWKNSFREDGKYNLEFRTNFLTKKVKSLLKSLKVKVNIKGYENLPNSGPCLLYGNHQDNIDPLVVMVGLASQTEAKDDVIKIPTFIAKHTLQYKSYTRYPLNCIDTFFLERDNLRKSLETVEKFGKFIKENKTFGVIFPEGARNRNASVSEFKPGSFKLAKKEFLPIIPFTINNSVSGFDFSRKETLEVDLIFHKKIPAHSFSTQTTIALSERVKSIVENSFTKPKYQFNEKDNEDDIEKSKSAIKWWKKQAKKEEKQAKKEREKRKQELKIEQQKEKENQKYEKNLLKKQEKAKNKSKNKEQNI